MEPTQEQLDAMIALVVKTINGALHEAEAKDIPPCVVLCNLIGACAESLTENDHGDCLRDLLGEILADMAEPDGGAARHKRSQH